MDFEIVPQLIIVLSAAGILIIVGRNYSKVKEATEREDIFVDAAEIAEQEKEKFLYLYKRAIRRINKENYQKSINKFWVWVEKLIRRLRIFFLKFDGKMVGFLDDVRKKNAQSLEKWKETTERSIRKNMENEGYSRFWNAKKSVTRSKEETVKIQGQEAGVFESPKEREPAKENLEEAALIADSPVVYRVEHYTNQDEKGEPAKAEDYPAAEETADEKQENSQEEKTTEAPTDNEDIPQEEISEIEKQEEEIQGESIETEPGETQRIRTRKEQECIETLMKNPADIKAYWKLGLIYSKRRNYDDALACFRQIVKIDPTYTKAKQKAIELMEKMKGKGK